MFTFTELQLQYKQEKADLISISPTQFVMAAKRIFETTPYCCSSQEDTHPYSELHVPL